MYNLNECTGQNSPSWMMIETRTTETISPTRAFDSLASHGWLVRESEAVPASSESQLVADEELTPWNALRGDAATTLQVCLWCDRTYFQPWWYGSDGTPYFWYIRIEPSAVLTFPVYVYTAIHSSDSIEVMEERLIEGQLQHRSLSAAWPRFPLNLASITGAGNKRKRGSGQHVVKSNINAPQAGALQDLWLDGKALEEHLIQDIKNCLSFCTNFPWWFEWWDSQTNRTTNRIF